jgi:lipoprotein-anchoring transpeptidase ErfK/SrfK
MKAQTLIKTLAMLAVVAVAVGLQALAQTPDQGNEVTPANVPAASEGQRRIVVSLEDRKLALLENGEVKKVYTVAVGKPSTPSPVGTFTIERRVANPTYSHNGQLVAPGPGNPVGTRWMGLSVHGYGIHGTNAPKSIGKAASHGCIRMSKADLEEFFEMVRAGDVVEIVGQRNEETAQLFAAPASPVATTAAAQTASVTQPTPVNSNATLSLTSEVGATVRTMGLMASRQ